MSTRKRLAARPHPSPARIHRHWAQLCLRIGERRAGSAGELVAANYLVEEFRRAGLVSVDSESFPCVSVVRSRADIRLGNGRTFHRVPARVLAGSPSTPDGRRVEADVVWVEMPEQAERLLDPRLQGKVIILFGPLPTRADLHRRLVAARPAAVIHVDDRLPFAWVKDDGVYPTWVRRFGMPPTVAVPFQVAWELKKRGLKRARACIDVELHAATSQNVVAEIAGRRPDLPLILLGAHHDTQCHNIGADDNASGVVALLELAALLGRTSTRPLRTIRFVSFGAEEQLSVGSARYVSAHRGELASIGLVLNLDSVASVLGHHWVIRAGTKRFGAWLKRELALGGLDTTETAAPMPFADHFPFSVFGVPAVTLYRPNMDSGVRWQHHSAHDRLDNVSVPELIRIVRAVRGVTSKLAGQLRWPFPRGLAPEQRLPTRRLARDLFDLFSRSRLPVQRPRS